MKAREILTLDNYNPLKVDIDVIQNIVNQIPHDGYIEESIAAALSASCLVAADKCADLLGQATLYLSYCDGQVKSSKASAIQEAIKNKVPSTLAKDCILNDKTLVEVTNKYNIAFAWRQWLEDKKDILIKTHHLCKDIANRKWVPTSDINLNIDKPKSGDQVEW